jgi:hypothetical protein
MNVNVLFADPNFDNVKVNAEQRMKLFDALPAELRAFVNEYHHLGEVWSYFRIENFNVKKTLKTLKEQDFYYPAI